MGHTNYFKLFCALAFFVFAAVSCWATAESLHLLLSSWPIAMCWIVSIGFFFIASWGSKMIVDSFNKNIYLTKRGLRLLGGIFILIIFWLVCSFPTNTHTFFYRTLIADKVNNDISTTQGYLAQIKGNTTTDAKIQAKSIELRNKVETKLAELEAEIKNPANPDFGPVARKRLAELAPMLGVVKIEELSSTGNSVQGRDKLCAAYRSKVLTLLDNRLLLLAKEMSPTPEMKKNFVKEASTKWDNLQQVKNYIENYNLDLNNSEDIKVVCDKLNDGYSTIRTYKQFVDFKSENDEKDYTSPNAITKVKRLISVFDVWEDFAKGYYSGHGFAFWIIISLLVDVAAFIFFDLAFKKS